MDDPRTSILATLEAACKAAGERGNPAPLEALHGFLANTAATYVRMRSRAITARARCDYETADALEATAARLLEPLNE